MIRRDTLIGALVLLATACALAPAPVPPSPSATPRAGGSLRIGTTGDEPATAVADFATGDPALPNLGRLMRCCLARTLLAYPGRSTEAGGTILYPDLAGGPPVVARDAMTWTFTLRRGIRYAPPFGDREVVAQDVVAGVERSARLSPELAELGGPLGYLIGAPEFAAGDSSAIAGIQSPDPYTVVFRLRTPYGGFGTVLADPMTAPIPPGAANGHDDDFGRHWVSSGPYMFEANPVPANATAVVLVRNPSWDRNTDSLRGAWLDRIEITHAGAEEEAFRELEAGRFDLLDRTAPRELVERYRGDPALAHRLAVTNSETIAWLPMNLAVPPFDDVAVRRAVNAVVDRAVLRDLQLAAREQDRGPQPPGVIAHHVFPDSLTGGLLPAYEPFRSAGDHGDLARGRLEMSASRYDTDRDGVCDADVCERLEIPAFDPAMGEQLRADLARIGIGAEVVEVGPASDINLPATRVAIQANTFLWGYNLTGSDLALLLRAGPRLTDEEGFAINASLVGASADQLREWGYTVTEVPSLDTRIDACDTAIGHLRTRCWAALDQVITEQLVPWVPLFSFETAYVASERVQGLSLDQSLFAQYPALDQISLGAE